MTVERPHIDKQGSARGLAEHAVRFDRNILAFVQFFVLIYLMQTLVSASNRHRLVLEGSKPMAGVKVERCA